MIDKKLPRLCLISAALMTLCAIATPVVAAPPSSRVASAARPAAPHAMTTRVDPMLYVWRSILEEQGQDAPIWQSLGVVAHDEHVGVTLRFKGALSAATQRTVEALGARFLRTDDAGRAWGLGYVYRAQVPWGALEKLEQLPGLVHAECGWSPGRLQPVATTSEMIGAAQARRRPELGLSGAGVTIADIDTPIDVLHPSLFRADGERRVDWVDVDMDGVFTPSIDTLSYAEGPFGIRQEIEPMRLLNGVRFWFDYDLYDYVFEGHQDGTFEPGRDWIYLDLDHNGRRDAGRGFDEQTPGYGEPIFVADDVDGDGVFEVGEPLVQLKTSKLRSITTGSHTFERGVDLIESSWLITDDKGHGTSTAGVLVGGQAGHQELVGLVPDADLINMSIYGSSNWLLDDSDSLRSLEESVIRGANVVLHEWTNPFTRPHDGSTNFEAAMDAAHAQGVHQITPLGNLNRARKSFERTIEANAPMQVSFVVNEGLQYQGRLYPHESIYGSIQWQGTDPLDFVMTDPDGEALTVNTGTSNPQWVGSNRLYAVHQVTSRGNSLLIFIMDRGHTNKVTQGTWTVEMTGATQQALVQGRISDPYTSWGRGVGWIDSISDRATLTFPATADSAFGVAAHAGRESQTIEGREIRGYSGRGPRIDGARGADITAPDDPFTAFAVSADQHRQGL